MPISVHRFPVDTYASLIIFVWISIEIKGPIKHQTLPAHV